jgi:hypothetical protein
LSAEAGTVYFKANFETISDQTIAVGLRLDKAAIET